MAAQTYTNATALAAAIDLANYADMPDLAAKLAHMLEQATKPSKRSDQPTKQQMRNKQLEIEIAQFVRAQPEPLAAKTIAARMGNAEITSSQKAASLLKNAAKMGWVVRLEVKGDVLWGAGEVCPA